MSIDLNQHWRKYNPTIHLGGADLEVNGKSQDWIVTIAKIQLEKVGDEGQSKPILYFTESINGLNKGMICGAKVSKTISAILGSPTLADWIGKQIQIFGINEKNFGKTEYVVRVRPNAPVTTRPEFTPQHKSWHKAVEALVSGQTGVIQTLKKTYELSEENEQLLKVTVQEIKESTNA